MPTQIKKALRLVLLLLLLSLPIVVWTQRWNIYDFWRLRGYSPPPAIQKLATDTTMNSRGRHLFYVYNPALEDRVAFSNDCQASERTIVLGCYVSGNGIYLFDVTDARLDGVKQVTAAHEMLHAAYDRLSTHEKEHIGQLLEAAFAKMTDQRVKDTVEDYRQNGADITNELHSILGTEVRELSPELEVYYRRYFVNRLKIVEFSEKYEQVFTERKQKVEAFDKQLQSLKQNIESAETELKSREENLQAEKARLDDLLASKNVAAYNAGVPGFNTQVNAYNSLVGRIRGQIDQYNRIVAERNAIAAEESELVKAIDSRPSTIAP